MIHKLKHSRGQIEQYKDMIRGHIYTPVGQMKAMGMVTPEPVAFSERLNGEYREYKLNESWGSLFDCGWFHITGTVPADAAGKNVALMLDFNGEGCIYDADGCPVRGITNVSSTYDYSLGMPGKRIYNFLDCAKGGEPVDLWIDAGCNDLFGKFTGEGKIASLSICTVNALARELYYDVFVLCDFLDAMGECPQYFSILYSLQAAVNELSDFTDEEFTAARKYTQIELSKKGGTPSLTFNAVGHAHIDLAWLWPIRETRRKGARTFSTQLELIDKNPSYIFGASQAQLYQWIKEDHPKLYSKVKDSVKSGNWELQGGTWVEPDTNIPSGESLVRQFLYGQRFYRQEFGETMRILWLPDVFGYSACLPQLMQKSGCEYFSTIKLSWSRVNKFPYHTFNWVGMDGSEVLTHMPPEGTYGSAGLPHSIHKAANNYQEQGLCDRAMCLYGISDGGGGCGPEHMERINRISNLAGLYPVEQTKAIDFFDAISPKKEQYPKYKGELYVEVHQGTLTTQAKNKMYNRKLECLLHDAELLCTQAFLKNGYTYPRAELETIWKEVLLYQFHDIIPGSSIKRVYDESVERYEQMEKDVNNIINAAIKNIGQRDAEALYNQLPWAVNTVIQDDDATKVIAVKAMSFAESAQAENLTGEAIADVNTLENDCIKVIFADDGTISSIFDKKASRECVKVDSFANELRVFTDVGDAWDFPINYRDKRVTRFNLDSVDTVSVSGRATRRMVFSYHNSKLYQDVTVTAGSKLIDFATRVEWNEKDKMLRTEFPLSLVSDTVNCDIQFGHVKRTLLDNTSIDYAKIEVAAHKWIDISENNYGVALFNDSKYGHYAKAGVLSINLLRSQNNPGESADIGEHEFNYALYIHDGDIAHSDVEKRAYEYNYHPIRAQVSGEVPFIVSTDCDNVIIETVKLAEDSDDIIVRLYENKGQITNCDIKICTNECILTNLIEDETEVLKVSNGIVSLNFHPFEVHTLKIKR